MFGSTCVHLFSLPLFWLAAQQNFPQLNGTEGDSIQSVQFEHPCLAKHFVKVLTDLYEIRTTYAKGVRTSVSTSK